MRSHCPVFRKPREPVLGRAGLEAVLCRSNFCSQMTWAVEKPCFLEFSHYNREKALNVRSASVSRFRLRELSFIGRGKQGYKEQDGGSSIIAGSIDQRIFLPGTRWEWANIRGPGEGENPKQMWLTNILLWLTKGTISSANHLWGKEWEVRGSVSGLVTGEQGRMRLRESYRSHMGRGGSLQSARYQGTQRTGDFLTFVVF